MLARVTGSLAVGPGSFLVYLDKVFVKIGQPNSEKSNRMERRGATAEQGGAVRTLRTYCGRVRPSNRYFGSVEEYLRLMSAAVTVSFLVRLGASEQQGLQDVLNPSGTRHLLEQWRLKFFLL